MGMHIRFSPLHMYASRVPSRVTARYMLYSMHCICSDKSIDDILSAQRDIPLPLEDMLACHTRRLTGCRSFIEQIRACVKDSKLVFEAEQQA